MNRVTDQLIKSTDLIGLDQASLPEGAVEDWKRLAPFSALIEWVVWSLEFWVWVLLHLGFWWERAAATANSGLNLTPLQGQKLRLLVRSPTLSKSKIQEESRLRKIYTRSARVSSPKTRPLDEGVHCVSSTHWPCLSHNLSSKFSEVWRSTNRLKLRINRVSYHELSHLAANFSLGSKKR